MDGKKVIITGVPGVGKTTVVNEALKIIKDEGIEYTSINFGSFMFEVAKNDNIVRDRDQMRTLDRSLQKRLQQRAAQAISQVPGNVLIDTLQDFLNGCCVRLCPTVSFSLKRMMTRFSCVVSPMKRVHGTKKVRDR
jgi:cytidylate kinase